MFFKSLGVKELQRISVNSSTVDVYQARTSSEVTATIETILTDWSTNLPKDVNAKIVIKPNLNNDLVALTGNCTDLRVLCALVEGLQARHYTDITVCDGSNVGVSRRDIDTFKRLRVDSLKERYGVKIVDLNRTPGRRIKLHGKANPEVSNTILDADYVITVPKIKTHAEAGMSCACKNWVGINRGQDKRHMHYDLAKNIAELAHKVPPDLIIVDGLVGMEGNGPGDGDPFHLGLLIVSDNTFINDLVVARLIDFDWNDIGYLAYGAEREYFTKNEADTIAEQVSAVCTITQAPKRSTLSILSERKELEWLKLAVRPIVSKPSVSKLAYKAKIIQDVYTLDDDTITAVTRTSSEKCDDCTRCADFCPTHLSVEEIGVKNETPDCINCLYCWFVCPNDQLALVGETNHMQRQIDRYKADIEKL